MDTLPTQKIVNHDRAALGSLASQIPSRSASWVAGSKRSTEILLRTVACQSAPLSKSVRLGTSFQVLLRLLSSRLRSSKGLARITILHHPKPTKASGTTIPSSDGQRDSRGSRLSSERTGSTYYTSRRKSLGTNWITVIPMILMVMCHLSHL